MARTVLLYKNMDKKKIAIIISIIVVGTSLTIGGVYIHNKNKVKEEATEASTATVITKYEDGNSSEIISNSSDESSSFDNSVEAQKERHPYLNDDGTINEEKYAEFQQQQKQQALEDAVNASPDKDNVHEDDTDESEDMINAYLLKFQSGEITVDTSDKTAIQSDYKIIDVGEFIYNAAIYLYTNQEACGDPTSLILHKTDNIQYVDVTLQNGYTYSLSFTSNNGEYTFEYIDKEEVNSDSSENTISNNTENNTSEERSKTAEETEFDNLDETTYTTTSVNDGTTSFSGDTESEDIDSSDSNN